MSDPLPAAEQELREACVMCSHSAHRHYRTGYGDGRCISCNCPGYEPEELTAASPVPDQQREAVARWLQRQYGEDVDPLDHFPGAWASDADELLAALSAVRGAEGGDRR